MAEDAVHGHSIHCTPIRPALVEMMHTLAAMRMLLARQQLGIHNLVSQEIEPTALQRLSRDITPPVLQDTRRNAENRPASKPLDKPDCLGVPVQMVLPSQPSSVKSDRRLTLLSRTKQNAGETSQLIL